jgi:hypothetical protein
VVLLVVTGASNENNNNDEITVARLAADKVLEQ